MAGVWQDRGAGKGNLNLFFNVVCTLDQNKTGVQSNTSYVHVLDLHTIELLQAVARRCSVLQCVPVVSTWAKPLFFALATPKTTFLACFSFLSFNFTAPSLLFWTIIHCTCWSLVQDKCERQHAATHCNVLQHTHIAKSSANLDHSLFDKSQIITVWLLSKTILQPSPCPVLLLLLNTLHSRKKAVLFAYTYGYIHIHK